MTSNEKLTIMTIRVLSDLRVGDRVLSFNGARYKAALKVTRALGPIEAGLPVLGVRVESPNATNGIEWVLYPAEYDGWPLEVMRR